MKTQLKVHFFIYLLTTFFAAGLSSCSKKVIYTAPTSFSQEYLSDFSEEKKLAYHFVTSAKDDNGKLESMLDEDFYSHDLGWSGNSEAFQEKRNADKRFSSINPIRILQDDSLVAVHSRMHGDPLRFRWDIMRIAEDKIQEHWSNVQDSLGVNPDGHSEIDGPTIPEQLERTDDNRALITRFMDQVMIREDGGAPKFFNFGLYIQHNRNVGDGVGGLLWAMRRMKKEGKVIKFKYNYHVIAEGNLVLSATEGYEGNEKTTYYDFFRIEQNKIVEHWDIIAPMDEFLYYQVPKEN
jgi:predicted SnoaL-like aldol condensation-catalyzing enzyme